MTLNLRALAAIGAGVIILALLIVLSVRTDQRDDARRLLGECIEQRAALQAHLDLIQSEADRRAEAARVALEEAQRVNRGQAGLIENLRRSANRPRTPDEPCVISPALREAQGAL